MLTRRSQKNDKLSLFFEKLKWFCAFSDDDISELLHYRSSGNANSIPITNLSLLLDRLNISLESIFQESIDYETLSSDIVQKCKVLSGKYQMGENSSTRFTTIYMMDYIRKALGDSTATSLMRRLQLHPELLDDLSQKNNILLPRDLCQHIAGYYGLECVEKMGAHSIALLREKLTVTHKLSECRNIQEFLVKFFYDVIPTQVEKNYSWEISSMSSNEVVVKASMSPRLAEAFKREEVCTTALEKLRQGFIKGIAHYYTGKTPTVEQLSSMTMGDRCDYYKILIDRVKPEPTRILH